MFMLLAIRNQRKIWACPASGSLRSFCASKVCPYSCQWKIAHCFQNNHKKLGISVCRGILSLSAHCFIGLSPFDIHCSPSTLPDSLSVNIIQTFGVTSFKISARMLEVDILQCDMIEVQPSQFLLTLLSRVRMVEVTYPKKLRTERWVPLQHSTKANYMYIRIHRERVEVGARTYCVALAASLSVLEDGPTPSCNSGTIGSACELFVPTCSTCTNTCILHVQMMHHPGFILHQFEPAIQTSQASCSGDTT